MVFQWRFQWDNKQAMTKITIRELQIHNHYIRMILTFQLRRKFHKYRVLTTPILFCIFKIFNYRGTTTNLSRNPPYHIKDAVDFEPLYPP